MAYPDPEEGEAIKKKFFAIFQREMTEIERRCLFFSSDGKELLVKPVAKSESQR